MSRFVEQGKPAPFSGILMTAENYAKTYEGCGESILKIKERH